MKNLDALLHHPPSPLQAIKNEDMTRLGLHFLVKRDDLLHPHVSGNKWRKLKHNLLEANRLACTKLITFGGAYSNHLAAVAAAGKTFGFSTLGVVSGEETSLDNPTLGFAKQCGMDLIFTSRANMRNYQENELLEILKIDTAGAYILPQGGANCLALPGCAEIVHETALQLGEMPHYFITACGTGATLAGIATGISGETQAIGISVLKGDFLQNEVEKLLANCTSTHSEIPPTVVGAKSAIVINAFHHGGYAKWTSELIAFINDFKQKTGIPLDPIYTGKAFYAAMKLAQDGYFPQGSKIVLVHTGGLQGIAGFTQRFGPILS